MEKQYVYILYAVEVRHLTDEEIEDNIKILKVKHPHPEMVDRVYYESYCPSVYAHKADVSIYREPIAFFYDEDEAVKCARMNLGDYNDGGCYNYAMIERLPIGYAYPSASSDTDYRYFRYDDDKYEEIYVKDDNVAQLISTQYDMLSALRNKN